MGEIQPALSWASEHHFQPETRCFRTSEPSPSNQHHYNNHQMGCALSEQETSCAGGSSCGLEKDTEIDPHEYGGDTTKSSGKSAAAAPADEAAAPVDEAAARADEAAAPVDEAAAPADEAAAPVDEEAAPADEAAAPAAEEAAPADEEAAPA